MAFSIAERNRFRAQLIIGELIRAGVGCFAVSPGSRSAPLVCALADQQSANTIIHYDERGSSFAAVGYARATGKPAAVICTSGTAVANLLPAVVEAAMDRVPLILLTADRPGELHGIGANQTINQRGIFGSHVRHELDLADNGDDDVAVAQLLSAIDTAVYKSLRSPAGPVQINCPFAEPLEPVDTKALFAASPIAKAWQDSMHPFRTQSRPVVSIDQKTLEQITEKINSAERGLIVVGRIAKSEDSAAIIQLAEKFGWPVFADIQSGLRLGNSSEWLVSHYDQLLLDSTGAECYQPDMVLHFGGVPVSKRLLKWLAKIRPDTYVQFVDHPMILDPMHLVTDRIGCDTPIACEQIAGKIDKRADRSTAEKLFALNQTIRERLSDSPVIDGPTIARIISRTIRNGHALFLGSSLSIREMDMYATSDGNFVPVGANRGASGIDGTIASACGFARGHEMPVTLLLGDLAMLHDLNSLALANGSPWPITIIAVNNSGGGIFHFLSIAKATQHFDRWFMTPHPYQFEHAAAMFGLSYTQANTADAFESAYTHALASDTSTIIEVPTDAKTHPGVRRGF